MSRLRAAVLALAFAAAAFAAPAGAEDRVALASARVRAPLEADLAKAGLRFGAPVLVRIFKLEEQLELWVDAGPRYRLFRTYPICTYSGTLGPKTKQGDRQAPEGFYTVGRADLRARSAYHLGFDLGYPNAFDRAHGYTGDFLLVHGSCVSIGCYAMGDEQIEEIYVLLDAALRGGQPRVEVHAFPFRFDRPAGHWDQHPWAGFWKQLQPAYAAFNASGRPPTIRVVDGRYRVQPAR
jgi:murein L,D-transpeptidase YafK